MGEENSWLVVFYIQVFQLIAKLTSLGSGILGMIQSSLHG